MESNGNLDVIKRKLVVAKHRMEWQIRCFELVIKNAEYLIKHGSLIDVLRSYQENQKIPIEILKQVIGD